MGFLKTLKQYKAKWQETKREPFDKEDRESIEEAYVVQGDYGLNVCFIMKGGAYTYVPLSRDSKLRVNDHVDVNTAVVITLSKPGENDIQRIEEGPQTPSQVVNDLF